MGNYAEKVFFIPSSINRVQVNDQDKINMYQSKIKIKTYIILILFKIFNLNFN